MWTTHVNIFQLDLEISTFSLNSIVAHHLHPPSPASAWVMRKKSAQLLLLCKKLVKRVNICQVIFIFFWASSMCFSWPHIIQQHFTELSIAETSWQNYVLRSELPDDFLMKITSRIVEQTFYVFITQHLATDKYFLMITKSPDRWNWYFSWIFMACRFA